MWTTKTFLTKTKRGNILKIVREHYLRDDLLCGSEACSVCPHKDDEFVLEAAPKSLCALFDYPHYLILDTNIVLHQIDVLEEDALTNVLILQTVLEEVKHQNTAVYRRLLEIIDNKKRRFYSFVNEHHKDTYVERKPGEKPNDRNDRAIRSAASWYGSHLSGNCIKGQFPRVVLLTDDEMNRKLAQEEGIVCCSIKDYVENITEHVGLIDKLSKNVMPETCTRDALYPAHLTPTQIHDGIRNGKLYQGTFHASRDNFLEGSASVTGFEKSILLQGHIGINRAVDGDLVAIEVFPEEEWRRPSDIVLEDKADDPGDLLEEESVLLQAAKAKDKASDEDITPTGKVVGIIRRKWRQYCGILQASNLPGSVRHLFVPAEKRVPRVRIETRQSDKLASQRILVALDSWPRNSRYPLGHFVRALGPIGDKDAENEVILLEHDVPHARFSEAVLACLPPDDWTIPNEEIKKRVDLRGICICSVDPPGCTDIDDALHARPIPGKTKDGLGKYEVRNRRMLCYIENKKCVNPGGRILCSVDPLACTDIDDALPACPIPGKTKDGLGKYEVRNRRMLCYIENKKCVNPGGLILCSVDPLGCTDIDDALHARSIPGKTKDGLGKYEVRNRRMLCYNEIKKCVNPGGLILCSVDPLACTDIDDALHACPIPEKTKDGLGKYEVRNRRMLCYNEIKKCVNPGGLILCSVDPLACTDIDDALHARPIPGKTKDGLGTYEVGVHIADVTHFVRPNTPLDKEASSRATTVYLVDKRIDMVPELLSSNLCSLRGGEERLAFSCVWEIDENANVLTTKFHKSVIKSAAAMTYEEAQIAIDTPSRVDEVASSLRVLNALAKKLKQRRLDNGALLLASPEIRFQVDSETHEPVEVQAKKMMDTNSMVEEFMLLANVSVAEKLAEEFPQCALLRRHPAPPPANFTTFLKAARQQGFELDVSTNKSFSKSLNEAVLPDRPFFNTLLRIMATRCMQQAVYFSSGTKTHEEFYHYGLACPIYTHFTSPIRRYADVIVHRLLAACIGADMTHAVLLDTKQADAICDNLNYRHRQAQYAGRASVALNTHILFTNRVEIESAVVLAVKRNALQVLIPKYGLEGPLYLPEDKFSYNEEEHFQSCSGVKLHTFDELTVRLTLDSSNLQHRKLVFQLVQPHIPGFSYVPQDSQAEKMEVDTVEKESKKRKEVTESRNKKKSKRK